jgi:formate C-acetyltransferase
MLNRVNAVSPDRLLSYDDRIALLRQRKIEETQIKSKIGVYQDGDDYGSIPAPEGFKFECLPNHENGSWYGYDGWSKNFCKLMDEHPVYIDPADAFACRWMFSMIWFPQKDRASGLKWHPAFPYDHLAERQKLYGIVPGIGSDAHFGGDYDIGFELGWGGLLEKIERFRNLNPGNDEFYDAEALAIKGVQRWIGHAISEAERLAGIERNPGLAENLLQMADVNRNILNGAPRTLREACQWACWFNMASRTYNRDGAGFQLDASLRRFYEEDLAAGRITRGEAVFYLACLLLNDPHYYQIGGLDENGRDLLCDFSYMALEAADKLNSSCNITVRVHENMDRGFLCKAVDYLFKNKNGWPRFSGDEALSRGFMSMGYSRELARKRIAVGCHWMSLPGLEYTLNDCVKINAAKVFEVAFDEMMSGGTSRSTELLWGLYEGHMRKAVETTVEGIRFHLKHMHYSEPELLLNLISHGPIEKGLDMTNGGAMYYNMCIDGAALATVADSFGALEQRVELEGRISWDALYSHLKADYSDAGGEVARRMM